MTTRFCIDCGADISDRHKNSKRCRACASTISYQQTGIGSRSTPCDLEGPDCSAGRLKRGLCDRHYHQQRYREGPLGPLSRQCLVCGGSFQTRDERKVTCSLACRTWRISHPGVRIDRDGRTCELCHASIARTARVGTRYCSTSCQAAASKRRVRENVKPFVRYLHCQHCGNPLHGKRAGAKFCSEKCEYDERNVPGSHLDRVSRRSCEQCGGVIPSEGRIGRKYCSNDCTVRSNQVMRRARRRGLPAEKFSRFEIFERDGWVCHICRKPVERDLSVYGPESPTMDHLIPLAHPATAGHVRTNVALAHRRCNIGKNHRVRPQDFGMRIKLLIHEVERIQAERRAV